MKRFFAILICSIIIFCHFVPVVPGQAAEVVIEQGIDILYKGWDMIYNLINGGVIQTSPYQGLVNEGTALAAFYEDWGTDLLKVINYITPSDDAIINSNSAITFPLKLGMTREYYNDFISNYMRYAVDDTNGFSVALTGESLAAWNRYNSNFINRYKNAFASDDVQVSPDAAPYQQYFDIINGRDLGTINSFYFANYPSQIDNGGGYTESALKYPFTEYSWIGVNSNNNVGNILVSNSYVKAYASDIIDINITGAPGLDYIYSLSINPYNSIAKRDWNNVTTNVITFYFNSLPLWQSTVSTVYDSINDIWFGSISEVLDHISKCYRNVNIYVNGDLWLSAGTSTPALSDFPDVITNSNGDILSHDVMFPVTDLYVDLINWQNLLEDKIADGDSITFDDLVDGGVIVDGNDIPITDNDVETVFEKKDASAVIDIELDDADTSDLLPDAPTPPDEDPTDWDFPEFPIPDLPDGGDPKSTGLSVLARIINVTNKSLPPELISMFWGICITLVILGIIKILHK